jgi:peptide/nickel transport system permease protein
MRLERNTLEMAGLLSAALKKTVQYAAVLILVTLGTFSLSSLIPGDFFSLQQLDPSVSRETLEQMRRQYGLDQPLPIRYARWVSSVARMDLGQSLYYAAPVSDVVLRAIGNTLWIGLPALVLGISTGVLAGTVHALNRDRRLGRLLDVGSAVALSLPSIVLGLGALLLAARTHWFPLGSMDASRDVDPSALAWLLSRLHHLALPVACLAVPVAASIERIQWAAAREAIDQPFLRAARARGIARGRVFFRYILVPSLNPVLSTSGPIFGAVLSGSLVLEVIFAWPGLGQVTYHALFSRDILLLVGCVVASGVLLIVGNLAADVLLFVLDPRTRRSARGGTS